MQKYLIFSPKKINTLRPKQNRCHFADIFKCVFLNENIWISIKIFAEVFTSLSIVQSIIFKLILRIDILSISCELALSRMPIVLTNDSSTLIRAMACCRQAAGCYLSQCWPVPYHHMASPGHNELSFLTGGCRFPILMIYVMCCFLSKMSCGDF